MKLLKHPVAIVAIAILLMISASAVALRLSASQVVDGMGQHILAQAFEDNNAVTVNETVESGDYAITLMGLISGSNLDKWNSDVDATHTYAVVALDRLDGTPLEKEAFYFLLNTSDLGIFADHTVYLAFYEDSFAPSAEKFAVAEDGSIAFTEDYQGAHALFALPLNPSLANPAAAESMMAPYLPPISN